MKRTEKRSMVNYQKKNLEDLCKQEQWEYLGQKERSENMLEERVERLEEKMQGMLEKVALMKTKTLKAREKPW